MVILVGKGILRQQIHDFVVLKHTREFQNESLLLQKTNLIERLVLRDVKGKRGIQLAGIVQRKHSVIACIKQTLLSHEMLTQGAR